MTAPRLAVVMSGFPRRSETFALTELLALESRGMLGALFATKAGDGDLAQPDATPLLRRVHYLRAGTAQEQALEVAEALRARHIDGLHGYFAHTPAAVAAGAAAHLRRGYSFSMHAKDARKVPPATLADRAGSARCVVACNGDVARALPSSLPTTRRVPHGVQLQRFVATPPRVADGCVRLLAVGRLVEKKGFHLLLTALARLPRGMHLTIVGQGPEETRLKALATGLGLDGRIRWAGGLSHDELPGEYAAADVVVVPSVVDRDGDRDGVPNVLLEAMASGRAVVASDAGDIPSAIVQGDSGIVVPAGQTEPLVHALGWLAGSPTVRRVMGERARARAEQDFNATVCAERFCHTLEVAHG